jgi:hypothetical protein
MDRDVIMAGVWVVYFIFLYASVLRNNYIMICI